jgi:DNA-binding GntR family transcriptional regulator
MLLRDAIYQMIRRAILNCEFQPGEELREQILAERYRVSRSPIRDSLLRLEHENLVTVLPRQGYRVNPVSVSDAEDIFGLRVLIEPACAASAARADDAELRALDRFRNFAGGVEIESRFTEYYNSFHRAVIDLCGNARMTALARDLDEQFQRVMRVSLDAINHEQVVQASWEHDAIIDALQAHDAERASRLSFEHSARIQASVLMALRLASEQLERSEQQRRTAE